MIDSAAAAAVVPVVPAKPSPRCSPTPTAYIALLTCLVLLGLFALVLSDNARTRTQAQFVHHLATLASELDACRADAAAIEALLAQARTLLK